MRITTDKSVLLGFFKRNDQLAEIAFEPHQNAPVVGTVLNVDGSLWKVISVKPSEYVKTLRVGVLWPA